MCVCVYIWMCIGLWVGNNNTMGGLKIIVCLIIKLITILQIKVQKSIYSDTPERGIPKSLIKTPFRVEMCTKFPLK